MRVTIKPTTPAGPALVFDLIGAEQLTGGAGGWDVIDRPRRRSAVAWSGTPVLQTVLPLQLNGMDRRGAPRDTVIEAQVKRLKSWALPSKGQDQPSVLRIAGPLQAPTEARWVIQDLAWGSQVRDVRGRRIQQQVEVTLLQFIAPTIVAGPAARANKRR